MPKALIYCRVSSERQVVEGHGIESQETRCRSYAKEKGYQIAKVFHDDGVSGALLDRPATKALLEYIDTHDSDDFVVIIDDLSRLARDVQVHIRLKLAIESRGAKLECPNFNFDDTPEGEFTEIVMAGANQLHRKQNRRQVIQKQKARLENGHWPFDFPPGLKNIKHPVHGKFLVPDEPIASIFKTAIHGFRDRQLLTQFDVVDFINAQYKAHDIHRKITLHGAQLVLTKILYAGYIEYPKWGISRRKGVHEGFISIETYDEVQRILSDRSKPKTRRDSNPDFPLRGLIVCSQCLHPLSGSWNRGRSGQHYANYFCIHPGCPNRYKSIRKTKIENDFLALFGHTTLGPPMRDLTSAVLTDIWGQHQKQHIEEQNSRQKRLQELTETISSLTKRSAKAEDELISESYDQEIRKLALEKKQYENAGTTAKYTAEQFGTATNKVMGVLENPVGMWQTGNIDDRLTVYFMHFDQKPAYDRETGFGTAQMGQSANLIRSLGSRKTSNVEMPGSGPGSDKDCHTHLQT